LINHVEAEMDAYKDLMEELVNKFECLQKAKECEMKGNQI
jgi:hypothetical protein